MKKNKQTTPHKVFGTSQNGRRGKWARNVNNNDERREMISVMWPCIISRSRFGAATAAATAAFRRKQDCVYLSNTTVTLVVPSGSLIYLSADEAILSLMQQHSNARVSCTYGGKKNSKKFRHEPPIVDSSEQKWETGRPIYTRRHPPALKVEPEREREKLFNLPGEETDCERGVDFKTKTPSFLYRKRRRRRS